MSPRPQVDHIRRPQILGAAAEVIAERGVAATRISDIAERSGTSAPAVLYWFKSKDELLAEALTFEEERFYDEVTRLLADEPSASRRLALLIDASSGPNELWIEFWARALRKPDAAATRRELDRRWRGTILEIVRDGQAAGEFGGGDPEEASAVLAALMDGLAVQVSLEDPEMPGPRMATLARGVAERLLDCRLPAPREPAASALAGGDLG
ncbi:MAG: TetR/AcrR family transcriptional regulator [Actinomycetota bacterium]|nr:TetR/AcrR family transcriptional regulator [Actinomycetota bacterium]